MSSKIAIEVSNLSKCYEIYDRPQDRLRRAIATPVRRALGLEARNYHREFWALRDVSFTVGRGETVGIVGHNGSGKSTLLQLIAGTLSPTQGTVEVRGRVAALLELGSGFNPEFSGRENVMLYGQLLGMHPQVLAERYRQIVEFSEIGDFIEQPVKTYSSGMAMRLAFSVVAHVDPEILIVDEALSVGDVFFQAKCMALMRRLMDRGMTLLFVSHDTATVKSLCSRAVLLDHGNMRRFGDTDAVVEEYYSLFVAQRQQLTSETDSAAEPQSPAGTVGDNADFLTCAAFNRIRNGKAEFLNVQLLDTQGRRLHDAEFDAVATLRMVVQAHQDLPELGFGFHLKDRSGYDVAYNDSGLQQCHLADVRAGAIYTIDWELPLPLKAGVYTISAVCSVPLDMTIGHVETCDHVPIALQFQVQRGRLPLYGSVRLAHLRSVSKAASSENLHDVHLQPL